jgi:hypothetical protein
VNKELAQKTHFGFRINVYVAWQNHLNQAHRYRNQDYKFLRHIMILRPASSAVIPQMDYDSIRVLHLA